CNKAFEQESETYHHCLYVHSVTGKQQCQWVSNTNFVGCGHKVRSRQELNRHAKSHVKTRAVVSEITETNVVDVSKDIRIMKISDVKIESNKLEYHQYHHRNALSSQI
ncbi:hypothetical protein HK099_000962, partial [Clydaea vesicula]